MIDYRFISLGPTAIESGVKAQINSNTEGDQYDVLLWALCKLYDDDGVYEAQVCGVIFYEGKMRIAEEVPGFKGYVRK